jgi:hypothetical protein
MCPASSAPIESFFSIAGWFDDERRARMSPSHLEMLAVMKANWGTTKRLVWQAVAARYQ